MVKSCLSKIVENGSLRIDELTPIKIIGKKKHFEIYFLLVFFLFY